IRAGHGLDDHRGDRVSAFVLDDLLDLVETLARELGVAVAVAIRVAAVLVRIEETDDAGDAGLVGPASRIAGQGDRSGRRAVIAAIPGHDLLPSGDHLRHPDRVLIRLGTAEREEEAIEIAGCELGERAADARADGRGHAGPRVRELL